MRPTHKLRGRQPAEIHITTKSRSNQFTAILEVENMGSSEKPSCEKVSMGTLLWRNGEPKEKHVSNSKIIDEMETAVAALCEQLDHSADEKEMDCAGWIDSLEKYIVAHNNRIYYSAISNCVFHMDEERFPDFLSNLGKVVDYAVHNFGESKDRRKRNL